MAKTFYLKLAATNLVRNKRMYGPYAAAVAIISGIFFIILNLIFSRSVANLSYGGTVQVMFTFGIVVMTFFTVGYMLYLNSFLIKRRKKEFGLYGVLGMERRHVARVITWESVILSGAALLLGLIGGMIFGRLAFMLLMNVLDTAQGSVFTIAPSAILVTLAIFMVIFVLATLYNLNQVRLANPVELLTGGQRREKKVRAPMLITLIGLILLGVAYYLAITVDIPAIALMWFWPAVILVIIATWLLFTGGSVFVLTRLQKSKRIYYKPQNFITISGLIHRMKQNAAGLANICILSTMVVVTVSCCCALYLGQDVIVREQNPNDINYSLRIGDLAAETEIMDKMSDRLVQLAEDEGVAIEQDYRYRAASSSILLEDGKFYYRDENGQIIINGEVPMDMYYFMNMMTVEDYNRAMGTQVALAQDEVLILTNDDLGGMQTIPSTAGPLRIQQIVRDSPFIAGKNSTDKGEMMVVVPDMDVLYMLARSADPAIKEPRISWRMVMNIDATQEQGYEIASSLHEEFRRLCNAYHTDGGTISYNADSIYTSRFDGYSLYGGLLFLGVFFALLFLINTVLIIYFKQISEGFDDCERFTILQKVGLSDKEVKSTINRQMLIVFMLPLVVALIHIVAASNMIRQMLGTFMLTDFTLTMLCILATSVIFIVVYLLVYRITSRTYYKLVKW